MRHLGSLLFGLVSAPVIWVLAGIGLIRLNGGISLDKTGDLLLGFVVILVVGGLLAALLLPRWSPVGTAAAGFLFLGMALWSMIDFGSMTDVLPRSFLGVQFALTAPSGALATLLAVLLGATVLVPHRWRSPRRAVAHLPGGAGQPGFPPYPPAGPLPAGNQFPPGGPGTHPPNYGPSAAPSYPQFAPPNYGPAAAPPHQTPSVPPYNAPAGTPHYGPPPTPGGPGRPPAPQVPGSPISGPPVPSAPPLPPTFSPLTPPPPPRPGQPSTDETTQFSGRSDETTQFGGGPDDDGIDGVTRRLGDR